MTRRQTREKENEKKEEKKKSVLYSECTEPSVTRPRKVCLPTYAYSVSAKKVPGKKSAQFA